MPLPLELVVGTATQHGQPWLPLSDDQLFPVLNIVMIGWALLALLPRWKYTPALSLAVVCAYSIMYFVLLAERLRHSPLPEGSGIGSLNEVVALFSDRAVLMAGWT